MPELTKSRIPSDVAIRSGLVSRTQTFTISTNLNGDAIFVMYPLAITSPSNTPWYQILNAATLDVNTGANAATATATLGPLNGLTSILTYRVTALSLEF